VREASHGSPKPATKRRILHLIDTGGPGGAETIFLELVRGLDPARWVSFPIVPRIDWLSEAIREAGFEPEVLATERPFDLSYVRRLASLARKLEVSLIQTHLLTSGVYASLVGRLLRVPVISTFHGAPDLPEDERFGSVKLSALSNPRNRAVFVSHWLRDHFLLRSRLKPDRCVVIPNGIDTSTFSPASGAGGAGDHLRAELGLRSSTRLVGAVGNLRTSKAYDILLEAASDFLSRESDTHLVIAGQTKEPLLSRLTKLRTDLALDGLVHFLGFRPDAPDILRSLDVFVLSSSDEGFSLSTVQAMATGLHVVATRCGGPESIVQEGITGQLVEPGNPEALGKAVSWMLNNVNLAAEMGSRARESAVESFGIQAMVHSYDTLYRESLKSG